jgi:hypothetical protein
VGERAISLSATPLPTTSECAARRRLWEAGVPQLRPRDYSGLIPCPSGLGEMVLDTRTVPEGMNVTPSSPGSPCSCTPRPSVSAVRRRSPRRAKRSASRASKASSTSTSAGTVAGCAVRSAGDVWKGRSSGTRTGIAAASCGTAARHRGRCRRSPTRGRDQGGSRPARTRRLNGRAHLRPRPHPPSASGACALGGASTTSSSPGSSVSRSTCSSRSAVRHCGSRSTTTPSIRWSQSSSSGSRS